MEYGIMALLLSIIIVGALAFVGSANKDNFQNVGDKLEDAFQGSQANSGNAPPAAP